MFNAFLLAALVHVFIAASKSNQTVFLNNANYSVVFNSGVYNCKVVCDNAHIGSLVFGNNTFNNTLENCSLGGNVLSMHDAKNNLLNATGNYSLEFSDNSSSVAIGHFFHLLVLNSTGGLSLARFIEILPKQLVKVSPFLVSMATNISDVYSAARKINYTLPAWGLQINASSNGSTYFPVESELVFKNKRINFNPYLYYSPYSGYDEVSETTFNASENVVYKPPFIMPTSVIFHEIFPANKPVFWNFSVTIFNKSENIFELRNTPQSFPNGTIVAVFHNLTNGTISYSPGIQKPGTYAFLGMFSSTYDHENTTSEFYSIGLSYCSNFQLIRVPGYYPFVYNSLTSFYVFWRTNGSCNVGASITASNVTVNCRGGYAKENKTDFIVENARNVTIENCKLYGNGISAINSQVRILNTSFVATNESSRAVEANNSAISMYNVSFSGFSGLLNTTGDLEISKSVPAKLASTSAALPNSVPVVQANGAPEPRPYLNEGQIVFVAFAILGFVLLFISLYAKHKPKARVSRSQ